MEFVKKTWGSGTRETGYLSGNSVVVQFARQATKSAWISALVTGFIRPPGRQSHGK